MKGAGGGVMFGKKTLDITDATLKQLNEDYASNKTKGISQGTLISYLPDVRPPI